MGVAAAATHSVGPGSRIRRTSSGTFWPRTTGGGATGPRPFFTAYGVAKAALVRFTETLAHEVRDYNIQVNCIAPGFIITDLNRAMWQAENMKTWLKGVQANPRAGTPEDVAPLAVFLASPGSDYITGQVIPCDGGYSTTAVWPFEA